MSEEKSDLEHYRLVPEQSRFSVQAFAEGLFSAFGHNPILAVRGYEGNAQFVPGTLQSAQARLVIDANSLVVTGDVKEKDRIEIERMMRDEVLETAKYPEIVFTSTSVTSQRLKEGRYRARIIGELTLHGVTQRNLWITSEVTVGDGTLRAQGEMTLKQTDFGIKLVSVAGGTLKVKNEVKIGWELAGSKL
jgi:polyisoprenoid-binding protein YceI